MGKNDKLKKISKGLNQIFFVENKNKILYLNISQNISCKIIKKPKVKKL